MHVIKKLWDVTKKFGLEFMVKNLGLGFMVQFLELLELWIIRV